MTYWEHDFQYHIFEYTLYTFVNEQQIIDFKSTLLKHRTLQLQLSQSSTIQNYHLIPCDILSRLKDVHWCTHILTIVYLLCVLAQDCACLPMNSSILFALTILRESINIDTEV